MSWPPVCFSEEHGFQPDNFGALLGGEIFRSSMCPEPPYSLVQGQKSCMILGCFFFPPLPYCLEQQDCTWGMQDLLISPNWLKLPKNVSKVIILGLQHTTTLTCLSNWNVNVRVLCLLPCLYPGLKI